MTRRTPARKVRYFEPVAPRLARNTVIESTFEVGRRFRCTMRVDCGQFDPGAVIRPEPGEWYPRMSEMRVEVYAEALLGAAAGERLRRRLPTAEEIARAHLVFLARLGEPAASQLRHVADSAGVRRSSLGHCGSSCAGARNQDEAQVVMNRRAVKWAGYKTQQMTAGREPPCAIMPTIGRRRTRGKSHARRNDL
jgi:hypothetical protein